MARNIFIQSLQQYPYGDGEHSCQNAIEDEVKEQDEPWGQQQEESHENLLNATFTPFCHKNH